MRKTTFASNSISAMLWLLTSPLLILWLPCADSLGQETSEWVFKDVTGAGFDAAALRQLTRSIKTGKTNTHAVLIEHDGSLIYEQYFEGSDEKRGRSLGKRLMDRNSLHDLRSVTKSVTSALLGIALADTLKNDDFETATAKPIGDYLPDIKLDSAQQAITLHHVLTMTAGLKWNEMNIPDYRNPNNDAIKLYRVRDPSQYALSRPVVSKPGSTWNYNGGCTYVIGDVIHKLTGQTIDKFAEKRLFEPLGISNYEWYKSDSWRSGNPSAAAGLRLTARDLAKIGSVYLHDGKWRGKQVVPPRWVELSTVRHSRNIGAWSGNGIWGYGYHWKIGKLPSGPIVYAAAGNGNQRLFVLPKERITVTIFAGQYNLPFQPHSEMIMKKILEARK